MSADQGTRNSGGPATDGRDGARKAGIGPTDRQALESLLLTTVDRSTGSGELGRRTADPGLREQLHAGQTGILLPLAIGPGTRVLEVGAGSGVRTRAMVEAGAEVIALEADPGLARAAVARVAGLDGASVVRTNLDDWIRTWRSTDLPFDLVLLTEIGTDGAARGPEARVAAAVSVLGPDGLLAIAVTNPWAPAGSTSAATRSAAPRSSHRVSPAGAGWSTRTLAGAIRAAGLAATRWWSVLPDLERTALVIPEALWGEPDGARIAGLLHRLVDQAPTPWPCDPMTAATAVRAGAVGLGVELAPAVLVAAARDPLTLEGGLGGARSWMISGPVRTAGWRRPLRLDREDGSWSLQPVAATGRVTSGSLAIEDVRITVGAGQSGEDLIVDALLHEGLDGTGTREALTSWWAAASRVVATDDASGCRPLDIRPATFLVEAGAWSHMDTGMRAWVSVPIGVLGYRAMLLTIVGRILPFRTIPGVAPSATVDDIVMQALAIAGTPVDPELGRIWLELETEVRTRLEPTGGDRAETRRMLRRIAWGTIGDSLSGLPIAQLLHLAERTLAAECTVAQAVTELDRVRPLAADRDRVLDEARSVAADRDRLTGEALALAAEVERLRQEVLDASAGQARAEARLADSAADSGPAPAREPAPADAAGPAEGWAHIDRTVGGRGPGRIVRPAPLGRLRRAMARLAEPLDRRRLEESGLFDGAWYLRAYPDVAGSGLPPDVHFVRHGGSEGRDPGPRFSTVAYLTAYPDVAERGLIAVLHYRRTGRAEGRVTTPSRIHPPG